MDKIILHDLKKHHIENGIDEKEEQYFYFDPKKGTLEFRWIYIGPEFKSKFICQKIDTDKYKITFDSDKIHDKEFYSLNELLQMYSKNNNLKFAMDYLKKLGGSTIEFGINFIPKQLGGKKRSRKNSKTGSKKQSKTISKKRSKRSSGKRSTK
jgi:hypothetical protein